MIIVLCFFALALVGFIAQVEYARSRERRRARVAEMESRMRKWADADAEYFACMRKMLHAKYARDVDAMLRFEEEAHRLWLVAIEAERAAKRYQP